MHKASSITTGIVTAESILAAPLFVSKFIAVPFISRLVSLCRRIRHEKPGTLIKAAVNRLLPPRSALAPAILEATRGRHGLEIGGPSKIFGTRNVLPVYSCADLIDNVNFATRTTWEPGLNKEGDFIFNPASPPGRQFLREATDLQGIPDTSYDFVLSSHCLEHVANPLAALREWHRVVRPGGHLVLLLPDPANTFDHRRPVTTLTHLQEDFVRQTGEDDLTHLNEILALHDLHRDPLAGTHAEFQARSQRNAENRCLHHHVFDVALQRAILEECGWIVTGIERVRPLHLLALARRPESPPSSPTA